MKLLTVAVLASAALVATPAHASSNWWGGFGGWGGWGGWGGNNSNDHDDDNGWGGWNGWGDDNDDDDNDDLDEEYCDEGWGDDDCDDHDGWSGDCDETPQPTGVPEIDANLLGTGVLLLVGGALVLASRVR
jgi:hypothetical protein